MVPFKSLKLHEEFLYNNETWIKVAPIKKGASCCGKVIANAQVVGNADIRRVFGPDEMVQKL